jgi:hypothetical protein
MTAAGMGVALSPFIESITTRNVRPPALSFRVTVTNVLVANRRTCFPAPPAVPSTSWVRL